MPWFKVDDQLHDHRKIRKLGKTKLPALGLWVACGSWAGDNLSDGFVPAEVVRRFDPSLRYAQRLVDVGLWETVEQEGEEGYRFHEWEQHQPTRQEVQAKRDAARERMRRVRQTQATRAPERAPDVRANGSRTSQEVLSTPSRPVPSRTSSSSHSSANATVADALGLQPDDDETTKVVELIKREHQPTALGPYVRTLAGNGDLPAFLERIRAPNGSAASRYTGPTHPLDSDPDGHCRRCPLPATHPCHRSN